MVGLCIRRRGLKFEVGLLLFANAFAAYATAAAVVSKESPILALLIRAAMTSEILLVRQDLAFGVAACPFSTDR